MSITEIPVRETINLTPTWAAVMPIYTAAIEHGTGDKRAARQDLMSCARTADRFVHLLQILSADILRQMLQDVTAYCADAEVFDQTAEDLKAILTKALANQGEQA